MRLDNLYDELEPGRLFTRGQLNDAMTGGPAYCRILGPGAGAQAFIQDPARAGQGGRTGAV